MRVARSRATALLLGRRHGVVGRRRGARSRRVRKHMHLGHPGLRENLPRALERALVLAREADDHVARQVEVRRAARAGGGTSRRCSAGPWRAARRRLRTEAARAGGERRSASRERANELVVHVVHLDRGEPEAPQPRRGSRLANEPGQRIAALAVAVAAEVDPGQDNLPVPLVDPPPHLSQHRLGAAAPGRPTDERDDTEVAREAASVLDAHECANAVETSVGLHAADRPDVASDEGWSLLAPPPDDDDVLGQAGEPVAREVRAAAGHEDTSVRAGRARGRLP